MLPIALFLQRHFERFQCFARASKIHGVSRLIRKPPLRINIGSAPSLANRKTGPMKRLTNDRKKWFTVVFLDFWTASGGVSELS